jgi:hypothetical protein
VAGLIVGALVVRLAYDSKYGHQELAPSLSYEGLLAVRPGMEESTVTSLIGNPIASDPTRLGGRRKFYAVPCALSVRNPWWCYLGFGEGLELDLTFEDGRLQEGSAEFWDEPVWACESSDCRVISDAVLRDVLP